MFCTFLLSFQLTVFNKLSVNFLQTCRWRSAEVSCLLTFTITYLPLLAYRPQVFCRKTCTAFLFLLFLSSCTFFLNLWACPHCTLVEPEMWIWHLQFSDKKEKRDCRFTQRLWWLPGVIGSAERECHPLWIPLSPAKTQREQRRQQPASSWALAWCVD